MKDWYRVPQDGTRVRAVRWLSADEAAAIPGAVLDEVAQAQAEDRLERLFGRLGEGELERAYPLTAEIPRRA